MKRDKFKMLVRNLRKLEENTCYGCINAYYIGSKIICRKGYRVNEVCQSYKKNEEENNG